MRCARVAVSVLLVSFGLLLNQEVRSLAAPEASNVKPFKAPGLGDPGRLSALEIVSVGDGVLNGPDARKQLLVDGKYTSGQVRDVTPSIHWQPVPESIVAVSSSGLVTPLADGRVKIVATRDGQQGATELTVRNFRTPKPINFPDQIVPMFTKNGCNAGGCHGKSTGQNGFRLSLLGFYPSDDYEFLVKEGRGRRLFPSAPDNSLLLLKATNSVAHGGGHRLEKEGYEYGLIVRWLKQGMPYGKPDDPVVERIEVFPAARAMQGDSRQQLAVLAYYSDGSSEDVTHIAQYESNDAEMAEVSPAGLVHTFDLTGDVAVMARFQGQVSVFRATLPLGVDVPEAGLPPRRNFIDEFVFAKLKSLGLPPSPVCDDATFVRRVTLDIAGRLPTADEARAFVADASPQKRDQLIDRLLDSADYADYFANKWSVILRNQRVNNNYTRGTYAFHDWIRRSLLANKPYDQFVREIVGAAGEMGQNPPVAWYRAVQTAEQQLEDTAQLFLGLRIQCARCHHHPFERWSQHDYYSFSAFFSRVGRKNGINGLQPRDEQRIFHNRGEALARDPRSGENLKPAGLGSEPLNVEPDRDPRQALVDWMSSPDNPFFAPALVNRYWKHFLGRGIVEPEDDMRVTNPASNPQLLAALASRFNDSRFDMKDLIRTICRSSTYQLGSEPNEFNASDKQNFSYYRPKRLSAEVLYDALNQVTATVTNFNGLPTGTRAVQLPDSGVQNYFLTVFGRPQATSPCECERSQEANLAQSLHLLNSNEVQGKLQAGDGRASKLARDKDHNDTDKIRELYAWAYAREPDQGELTLTLEYLGRHDNKQQAYEDILWALINTKEFLFNH